MPPAASVASSASAAAGAAAKHGGRELAAQHRRGTWWQRVTTAVIRLGLIQEDDWKIWRVSPDWRVFRLFLGLRLFMACAAWTWHVPDETWQSVEVAHRIVFGYGYQTWEWRHGLRSYVYPLVFVPVLHLLKITGCDFRPIVVLAPRLVQGALSAVGDYYIVRFCRKHWTATAADWTLFFQACNWFLLYCSSRTLANTMEMTLTNAALFYYPSNKWLRSSATYENSVYVALVTLGFVVRPTTAIMWAPLIAVHLYNLRNKALSTLVREMLPPAALLLVAATAVDSFMYGRFVCVAWNFFVSNVVSDVGSHYGVQSVYWYLVNALPVIFALFGIIPMFFGWLFMQNGQETGVFAHVVTWVIFVYSMLPHKEYRFLLPIIPLLGCFVGDFLDKKQQQFPKHMSKKVMSMLVMNVPAVIYFSLVHQRGTTAVVSHLASSVAADPASDLLFLMPCHSTPYYSHLHANVRARFLTCEPNVHDVKGYLDEADVFYRDLFTWLESEYEPPTATSSQTPADDGDARPPADDGDARPPTATSSQTPTASNTNTTDELPPRASPSTTRAPSGRPLPTHIVCFDVLAKHLQSWFSRNKYQLCADFFHTHFPDGRVGGRVQVFCKMDAIT